jgi:hypothetical protein
VNVVTVHRDMGLPPDSRLEERIGNGWLLPSASAPSRPLSAGLEMRSGISRHWPMAACAGATRPDGEEDVPLWQPANAGPLPRLSKREPQANQGVSNRHGNAADEYGP